jgi:L-seryl-tRNA(Ser) seleniumtransferase
LISVAIDGRSSVEVDSFLRANDPPVIGRISDDRYLLDLRTVLPNEQNALESALEMLAES